MSRVLVFFTTKDLSGGRVIWEFGCEVRRLRGERKRWFNGCRLPVDDTGDLDWVTRVYKDGPSMKIWVLQEGYSCLLDGFQRRQNLDGFVCMAEKFFV